MLHRAKHACAPFRYYGDIISSQQKTCQEPAKSEKMEIFPKLIDEVCMCNRNQNLPEPDTSCPEMNFVLQFCIACIDIGSILRTQGWKMPERPDDAERTGRVSPNVFSEAHVVFFRTAYPAAVLHRGIVNSNIGFASRRILKFFEFCGMGQPSLYKMSIQFLINKPDLMPCFPTLLSDKSICQSIEKCVRALPKVLRSRQTDIRSSIEVIFSSGANGDREVQIDAGKR